MRYYGSGQSFDNDLEEKFFKDIDEVGDIYLWGRNIVSEVFFGSKNKLRSANETGTNNVQTIVKNTPGVVAGTLSWFGSLRLRQIRSKTKACSMMYPDSVRNDRFGQCFYDYDDGSYDYQMMRKQQSTKVHLLVHKQGRSINILIMQMTLKTQTFLKFVNGLCHLKKLCF